MQQPAGQKESSINPHKQKQGPWPCFCFASLDKVFCFHGPEPATPSPTPPPVRQPHGRRATARLNTPGPSLASSNKLNHKLNHIQCQADETCGRAVGL